MGTISFPKKERREELEKVLQDFGCNHGRSDAGYHGNRM
jgi:hypothetical protein